MYSKIIFVLATVCIVNASVLTVNVYDDDAETEVKVRPSRCKSKACDWLCRRLNKTNGTCVEGHCKCDKPLNAEDADDMTDPVELLSPGDCNLRACEQLCRRLGFPGGVCVNGRCKCDNFLKTNDAGDTTDPQKLLSPGDCNLRACEQLYRQLGFPGGVCVNGRCNVRTFKTNDVNDMTEPAENFLGAACNSRACLLQCRKLGYPRGNCVKERCQCDYLLNTKDAVAELSVDEDSLQSRSCNNKRCNQICRKQKFRGGACGGANCYCNKFLSLQEDADTLTDSAVNISPLSCNSIACDDQCRRTGWHSGVCINGQCKCDYFVNTEDTLTDSTESISPLSCNSIACDDQCRRTGWHSGVCINGQCKCDYFLYKQDDAVSENSLFNVQDSVSPKRCTPEACSALCRRLQLGEGVCEANRCRCNNYKPTPKVVTADLDESVPLNDNFLSDNSLSTKDAHDMTDPAESLSPGDCNLRACEQLCRRLGFPGGACVNGRCSCDNFLNSIDTNDMTDPAELLSARDCNLRACEQLCRRLGFPGGVCVNGRCKCDNFLKTEVTETIDEVTEESLPVSELLEDQSEHSCNMQACDQLCRRLKFRGGVCVNGRCKCDNFLGTQVDAVDEYLGLATRRVCHVRKCNRTCTRRGYAAARCVNGRCECYDKIERQVDISLQNDVTSAENEESNEILRTNEEEPIETARSACNTVFCNQFCHRLKYAGGWCRFGQCQCY